MEVTVSENVCDPVTITGCVDVIVNIVGSGTPKLIRPSVEAKQIAMRTTNLPFIRLPP
jgi:hypothetical protein